MRSLIGRNLRLFFASKSGIFFSMLGALISFILYLIFLRKNMTQSWQQIDDSKKLLDLWLMGGTLAVTAITTTANSLGQMVKDRESNRLADLILTDQSYLKIHVSYLISAWLIGTIMQMEMYIVMQTYFSLVDGLEFDGSVLGSIFLIMMFSSLLWTVFNLVLLSFVKDVETLGKISTIIGTAAGFFAGVYMPIGMVPKFAQNLMKLTPAPYNAAMFRQIMMKKQLEISFKGIPVKTLSDFKTNLGIIVNQDFNFMLLALAILSILVIILYKFNKQVVVNKI